jgi:hypothetical protein
MVLKRFAIFLVLVLALNALIFGIMYETYYRKYRIFPKEQPYRGLLLADSHGLCLGNELEQNGIFNFSAESDNYADMRIKLRYFLKAHPETRFLILSADDHTLSRYREELNNQDRNILYRDFGSSLERKGWRGGLNYLQDVLRYYFVLFNPRAADISKRYLAGKLRPAPVEVKLPEWSEPKQKMELAKARFQSQFPGKEQSEILQSELLAMLMECREAGILVLGVRFPLSPVYAAMVKGNGYGADRLLQKNGIPLFDFEESIPDEAGNFENQDHLSLSGGRKLASLLRKKIPAISSAP